MVKTLYSQCQGSWVISLVWELRSRMPHNAAYIYIYIYLLYIYLFIIYIINKYKSIYLLYKPAITILNIYPKEKKCIFQENLHTCTASCSSLVYRLSCKLSEEWMAYTALTNSKDDGSCHLLITYYL